MENFLLYIGKSALAAGAFYLVYLVLFQNQKQFTFNRIYLPVSLALSFVIPLISFTTVNYVEPLPAESNPLPVFTESFEPVVAQQSRPQFIWEWYHYLFAIYAAGTALFLFRLLLGHGKAWNIIRKSRVQELFNRLVNISKKDIHPFSFFSKIVLSENTLSHPNLNQDTEVTGYGSKSAAGEAQKVKEQLFEDETKRVIRKISKLDSDKFKGKTVGITVKFILQ